MPQHMTTSSVDLMCVAAPEDAALLTQWETHLHPLQQATLISIWSYLHLAPGTDTLNVQQHHLTHADIVIFLLSASFFNSQDCLTLMKAALQRSQTGNVRVIPLLLRPVAWQESLLGTLAPWPPNGKPILLWEHQDEGWEVCVQELRRLLGRRVSKVLPSQHNAAEGIRWIVEDMSSRSTSQTNPSADTGPSTASPGQAHEKSHQPLSASSGPVKLPDIPKQAQGGKLWLTLALTIFFLILLFTGGLLFLWKNARISTPEETLITFCSALQKQDYQTAYNTYTSVTKQIVNEQAATNDWSTNGQHGRIINCWVKGSETSGDYDHNMVMYLLADGTKIIYHYYLIQENGVWKIIDGRGGEKAP